MSQVLFVCTGNVCRSPLAEAVLRHLLVNSGQGDQITVDSAATTKWHENEPPTSQAIRRGELRGYSLSRMRSRPVETADFETFDWIFAMTREHRTWLNERKPAGSTSQIMLFSALSPQLGMIDIPDPWGGGAAEYDQCLDQLEVGCHDIFKRLTGA